MGQTFYLGSILCVRMVYFQILFSNLTVIHSDILQELHFVWKVKVLLQDAYTL